MTTFVLRPGSRAYRGGRLVYLVPAARPAQTPATTPVVPVATISPEVLTVMQSMAASNESMARTMAAMAVNMASATTLAQPLAGAPTTVLPALPVTTGTPPPAEDPAATALPPPVTLPPAPAPAPAGAGAPAAMSEAEKAITANAIAVEMSFALNPTQMDELVEMVDFNEGAIRAKIEEWKAAAAAPSTGSSRSSRPRPVRGGATAL